MKTIICSGLFVCIIATHGIAADSEQISNEDSGYHAFLGARIFARYNSEMFPVVSADRKGIYLDIGKRAPKRVRWSTPCLAKPVTSASDNLVKAEEFNYTFYYRKDAYQEERAYDDIREKERETSFQIGLLGSPNGSTSDQIEELELERDEFVDQMESAIEKDELLQDGFADSVNVSIKLTPSSDIEEAFCAVMADYNRIDGQRRVAVKVQRIGEMLGDIPKDLSLSFLLVEGDYKQSRLEFFLFSGDGSPIPTTLSRGLRKLTKTEPGE